MRLILIILVFVSSLLLAGTTASAGISTKKQDILKLIGTSYALNGKFAWVEINGEDYGWTREGENVGKYKIVMVKMGKVKLELFGRADQPNLSEQQKEIIEVLNTNLDMDS